MPAPLPEAVADFGWYGAGYAVCIGGTDAPDFYPPLNDLEAQGEWLAGFEAAWCDCPDAEAIRSILFGDGMGGESLDTALGRALEDRPELLRQVRAYRAACVAATMH
ncbi:histidine kinase [Thiocystis violacea]|uniref:histidine kinase n=1 Tax=Thiocystis violacea TaxID=13725 RepID=UPI0019077FBF|nr:histidine kinase [Thiocystis violacea]MBK1723860.1 histidine kinase [Thiocystis violacea]